MTFTMDVSVNPYRPHMQQVGSHSNIEVYRVDNNGVLYMNLERSELETTMTWDSEQQIVRIFSARPVDQRRLAKAMVLPVKDVQPHGLFYEIPLSRLFWKVRPLPGSRPKRDMSKNFHRIGTKRHSGGHS